MKNEAIYVFKKSIKYKMFVFNIGDKAYVDKDGYFVECFLDSQRGYGKHYFDLIKLKELME